MHKLLATFLLLSLSLPAQVFAGPAADADAAYARGDHVGALKIYQALAADGLATAKFNLGVMYDFGQGVAKDPAQAVRWYRAAAAQGHGGAQFNLGGMYFDGVGVAQDHVRSYAWFTLAAAAGAPGASRNRSALAKLLDVAQMEQAQRLVRDCLARNFAGCE